MDMENRQRTRAIEDWARIIFFIIAIWLPLLSMNLFRDSSAPSEENRQLASFPAVRLNLKSLATFPQRFNQYFNDNFGMRSTLIRWQAVAKVKWLGVSTSPKVIVGKDGWLFDDGDDEGIASYRSGRPFTHEQLARWRQVLTARRDWLAQRGIPYIFVVVPEKQTIYPEYLPGGLARPPQVSRLDQLIADLKENSNLEILDLRPALLEAKHAHSLFLRTDTHWNNFGGLAAYQAIIRETAKSFPGMQPMQESDCELFTVNFTTGDLARLLGLNGLMAEELQGLTLRRQEYTLTGDMMSSEQPIVSQRQETNLPHLVMFRDSFATFMIPLISQHFSRAVYVWDRQHRFHRDWVEAERPNVVIQEMVERFLVDNPPDDPPQTGSVKPRESVKPIENPKMIGGGTPILEGVHDITNCNGVIGWAWDRNRPDEPVKVDIYDGDKLLATVTAGEFRQDLLDAGIGNGKHGFLYIVPPQLKDARPHMIRMKYAGTSTDLAHTPKQINCSPE